MMDSHSSTNGSSSDDSITARVGEASASLVTFALTSVVAAMPAMGLSLYLDVSSEHKFIAFVALTIVCIHSASRVASR